MWVEYTIRYVYGSYSGAHRVTLREDDERDPCNVMWAEFRREGYLSLGMATMSAKVTDRRLIRGEGEVGWRDEDKE